jgi:hypothetical protein
VGSFSGPGGFSRFGGFGGFYLRLQTQPKINRG